MSFNENIDLLQYEINKSQQNIPQPIERFKAEIDFARRFVQLFPDKQDKWNDLILEATELVAKNVSRKGAVNYEAVVKNAEDILAPIGEKAKEYTIHCCGHAHIDMNWMWPWQETVNVTHDTFSTADKLMSEFPEFRLSQSQASTYIAMEEYAPEIFKMIKRRVKQGKWDITASMWVEGDKNIVSGESLCRHMLYTRQYFRDKFGLQPEDIKIDWSPDTFGHAWTLPSIITRGGVTWYYHMRTGPGPWLYKWKSPDGSEVLVYNDKGTYNGQIEPYRISYLFYEYEKETGLKDFMFMYGVGDHGGGPTRADLRKAREIAKWPIYPTLKLSRTDEFYTAVENANPDLPVINKDLNFIFEGCYTAQSNVKRANRVSEIILPEAETMAVIAGSVAGMPYPYDQFLKGWRHTLFNHFHDILPGSGVHATYEYAQGLFQEIQATAGAIRTRALRSLASRVDTASAARFKPSTLGGGLGDGLGAGVGDPGIPGGVTAYNQGAEDAEPILIYNQKPWQRSETVFAKVWNKNLIDDRVVVRDSKGKEIKGHVVARGKYWGHSFATVAFRAENVPALGYKVYAIDNTSDPVAVEGAMITKGDLAQSQILENEYLKVEVDKSSGAVKHLIDKNTGFDYVPEGQLLGVIEACQEAPHGMTSWVIGQVSNVTPLTQGGRALFRSSIKGPNRVAVSTEHHYRDSRIVVEVALNAGSRMVEFNLKLHWVERGTHETGVPTLRAAFPVNVKNGNPRYEIPFGSQARAQEDQEIPALKWADLSDESHGITLVNHDKYGHYCNNDVLRLSLLRSSYDPDPLPEIADHEIKFAVIPHDGPVDIVKAIRQGEEFSSPMAVVSATVQEGELPAEKSFVEVLTPNVFVSAVKRAEDSDAVVVRMFEVEGKDTKAEIRISDLIEPGASAVETDHLERPLPENGARLSGDVVTVNIPAYGQATVIIG